MMLYLDTSALVKLYVDEPLSQELSAAVDEAEAVATSLLASIRWRLPQTIQTKFSFLFRCLS